jgi:hypothetical protein
MKAWGSWIGLLVGLFCATNVLAELKRIPIQDRNVFESQFIECAMKRFQGRCLLPLFRDHGSPKFGNVEPVAIQLNTVLQEAGERLGVYEVHTFRKIIKADTYDDRIYLIEMGDGTLICFRVVFRNVLGKWYVGTYRLSADEEAMLKLLDLPLPNGLL